MGRCVVLSDPNQLSATARAVSAARSIFDLRKITLVAPEGLYNSDNAPCDVVSCPKSCFDTVEAASALLNHFVGSNSSKDDSITHVLAPMTPFGRAVLPRAAAAASVPCITDVIKLDGHKRLLRHAAAGKTLETLEVNGAPIYAAIKTVLFGLPSKDSSSGSKKPTVSKYAAADKIAKDAIDGIYGLPSKPITKQQSSSSKNAPELTSAKRVVAGGLGMQNKEGFSKLYPLAETIGAAVGASRSAVENGFCPESQQVGQTGQTVAPELYVAVGISGAVQHTAGMRESRTVVVINTDENAPFFSECDYGLVAPAENAIPELAKLCKK